jgi:tRNA threonylcarbamoyl adenosine modification protein (Sua5/YciO/YrdC/YwlC family)
MLEYVLKNNIDSRIINRSIKILNAGGLVAYPTDTSWGIGCSSLSKEGILKLQKLKGDFKNYTITLICSEIVQISELAELNNTNFRFIKRFIPGPYVFILPALKIIEKKINMKRTEIGIRIPDCSIPLCIVNELKVPLFSITASRIMTDISWWDIAYAEENLFEYGYELENINGIDMIIDSGEPLPKILTTVIDLTSDEPVIIRQGTGII